MNSVPLHPAIVHAPLALAMVLPLIALAVAVALLRDRAGRRAWLGVVALQALMVGSVWVAFETGENEEHRVEKVVGEAPVESHERHAKLLFKAAGANLGVGLVAALVPAPLLPAAAALSAVGCAAVTYCGFQTGRSGGELVYVHGAGAAYTTGTNVAARPGAAPRGHDRDHDD